MYTIMKEYNLFFLILGFQLLVLASGIYGYEAPPNCLVFDCPQHAVIYSIPEFEIRSYRDANWIAFPVKAHSYKLANATEAQNRAGVNISLTWPVLVDVGFSTNSSTTTTYFYLPEENQARPPVPLHNSATVVVLPRYQYAAVRRYHHNSNDKNIKRNVVALRNALRKTPWAEVVKIHAFSAATYNDP